MHLNADGTTRQERADAARVVGTSPRLVTGDDLSNKGPA